MTTNSHESAGRAARYAQHVAAICAAFGIMYGVRRMKPEDAGSGYLKADAHLAQSERRKAIEIAPVTDETTYAVALHEIGHLLHPTGNCSGEFTAVMRATRCPATLRDVRLKLLEEESAWVWAHVNALEWTPAMSFVEAFSINSYRRMARQFGVKP